MQPSRRQFVILTAGLLAGCKLQSPGAPGPAAPPRSSAEQLIDAGPAATYSADGVYDAFADQGFFLIRRGPRLFALSSICTHRACLLDTAPNHCFHCDCHGSCFDPDGKVTKGPARRNLPLLPTTITNQGRLLVRVPFSS